MTRSSRMRFADKIDAQADAHGGGLRREIWTRADAGCDSPRFDGRLKTWADALSCIS